MGPAADAAAGIGWKPVLAVSSDYPRKEKQ
jgi:hypothetical protein